MSPLYTFAMFDEFAEHKKGSRTFVSLAGDKALGSICRHDTFFSRDRVRHLKELLSMVSIFSFPSLAFVCFGALCFALLCVAMYCYVLHCVLLYFLSYELFNSSLVEAFNALASGSVGL